MLRCAIVAKESIFLTNDICKYCAKDFLDWMKSGDSQDVL